MKSKLNKKGQYQTQLQEIEMHPFTSVCLPQKAQLTEANEAYRYFCSLCLTSISVSLNICYFFKISWFFQEKGTPEERKKKASLYFQADQIILMDPISGRTLSIRCLEQTDWQSLHQLVWVFLVENGRSVFESALGWVSGLENSWKSFPGNKVLFSYFSLSFYRSSDFWTCQVN